MTKITLIGAGSVVFAKNLIGDILQFPELAHSTISLMDIDPARLQVARVMTERMIAKLGVRARVEATTDRTEAIRGARYVICTIQVGGYKPGTVIDFEIPKKYGVRQTIADTLGVGGVFRALRTIPELLKIAQDIERVGAPGCLLLNYTNPMAMNCMAVDKAVGIPHVGLCHSVQGTSKQLAAYAGLDYGDVSYRVAGINHMAFFLEFKYRGKDAYPLLFEALENPARTTEKVRFEMMRRLGYFVTESSEHQSEYTPHFIHHGPALCEAFDIPLDEYIRRCESGLETWAASEKELIGEGRDIAIKAQSEEYGAFIIHSCETGVPRVIYGNVPNRGLITNLPNRCCVEVPCLIDRNGIQATHIGELPPQLAAICRTNVNVQELAVEAALTLKREHIYHAVMHDPHTAATLPLDKIWAMCDELIEAHQKVGLLGEFAPTLPNTGTSRARIGSAVVARIEPSHELPALEGAVEFTLTVENHGDAPFRGRIALEVTPASAVADAPGALEVDVPAHQKMERSVILNIPENPEHLTIAPDSSAVHFLGKGFHAERRRVLPLPPCGAAVDLDFMSTRLVQGTIQAAPEGFRFQARVQDTDLKPKPGEPWAGSCIELFFKPILGEGRIRQLFLIPQPDGGLLVLNQRLEPLEVAHASVSVDKAGYTLEVTLPWTLLEVRPPAFLFDFIVAAGALGDAHSACRVGWNKNLLSYERSLHFTYISAE